MHVKATTSEKSMKKISIKTSKTLGAQGFLDKLPSKQCD